MKSNKTISIFTRAICWRKLVTKSISSFENWSHLASPMRDAYWKFMFLTLDAKKAPVEKLGEGGGEGARKNGPWRKTTSSRCNAHCWPPAVSRRTDRFAGFSRLLRNHQSYSAIRSDNVAPRDTRGSLPFLLLRSSSAFPRLSTPPTNYTRSYTSIIYRSYHSITLPYLSKSCFKPLLTKDVVLESYIGGRAIFVERKAAVILNVLSRWLRAQLPMFLIYFLNSLFQKQTFYNMSTKSQDGAISLLTIYSICSMCTRGNLIEKALITSIIIIR